MDFHVFGRSNIEVHWFIGLFVFLCLEVLPMQDYTQSVCHFFLGTRLLKNVCMMQASESWPNSWYCTWIVDPEREGLSHCTAPADLLNLTTWMEQEGRFLLWGTDHQFSHSLMVEPRLWSGLIKNTLKFSSFHSPSNPRLTLWKILYFSRCSWNRTARLR